MSRVLKINISLLFTDLEIESKTKRQASPDILPFYI